MNVKMLLDKVIRLGRRPGTLRCREVFPVLSEFLDGELEDEFMERVQRHAEDCPPCRNLLRSLAATKALCAEAASRPMPPGLQRELLTRLRPQYQAAWRYLEAGG